MHVAWMIGEKTYALLRTFRRWRQAKREADKVERWYGAQGIDVQAKIIKGGNNGETQKTTSDLSTMSVLRDQDHAEVAEERFVSPG